MLQTGNIIGGTYQIVQEIGHGGTGVVYLAYHINLQKYIVLKRVTKQIHSMEALRREADILKNLRHTNIPQIYDFVIENGEVFTVMDYIEGMSLDKYIGGPNIHSEEQLLRWFRELTDVLVYLGSRKPAVIHSDIKPENIIITPQGSPVLIDFNISLDKSDSSRLAGISRNYASPEQGYIFEEISNGRTPAISIDARTDIYSLGAVFYTLITGIVPDCRYVLGKLGSMQGLIYSSAFMAVIDKCIEWDREKRFKNAGKLASAVTNLYRMDRNYRKYTALRVASWIISAGVFASGCFCVLHGVQINNRAQVQDLYAKAVSATDAGDFGTSGEIAEEILSHRSLHRQLDTEKEAEMYHALADSEYVAGNYTDAAANYRKALDVLDGTDSQNVYSYRSDLAVAYLKNGDLTMLSELEAECEASGIEDENMQLVKAAALKQSGDTAAALNIADSIIDGNGNQGIKAKACVIAAQCCSSDQLADRLRYMRKVTEYSSELKYVRECAALEYEYAGRPGLTDFERKAGAEKAAALYEKICSFPSAQITDRINLGISYYYAGNYEKALDKLTVAAGYSDDYRIRMYQALAAEKTGDLNEARNYCADALNACGKEKRQGWEDDYQVLQDLSDRLY